MRSDQRRIALYAIVVFVSSALLLVLEIVAARLIAPHVGVSLYTWSAVIGVVLAGLSIGNAIGGAWADRRANADAAGGVLIAAGLTALLIPWLLLATARGLDGYALSILSTSLILVLALFLLPAILIGIVTPLLTTLALAQSSRTGHIVGMMHALGATGSILGTFAAAWWLIPAMGSRNVVLACGLMLLLSGLLFIRPLVSRRRAVVTTIALLGAAVLVLGTFFNPALASPCDRESSYFCIRTIDEGEDPRFGKMGKQKCEDTGPLTQERMKNFDAGEVIPRAVSFMENAQDAGEPFFVWLNTSRMHLYTRLGDDWRYAAEEYTSEADLHGSGMLQHDHDIVRELLDRRRRRHRCHGRGRHLRIDCGCLRSCHHDRLGRRCLRWNSDGRWHHRRDGLGLRILRRNSKCRGGHRR